jgi:two-component system phosphate regulon sensor histidine kinase PhoR
LKLGIRAKLFLASIALIALSFAAADAYLSRAIDSRMTEAVRADLCVRAALIAHDAAGRSDSLDDLAAWDGFADTLGHTSAARVTIIRKDGVVIGDSEVEMDGLKKLDNHATRPEVVAALADGQGSSNRMSATVQKRMMYAAVPIQRDGAVIGVARVARPLRVVDEAVGQARSLVAIASLVAMAMAILMSSLAAEWLSRDARDMTAVARRMTAGDLEARTRVTGNDELGELGQALDQLAASLSKTMGELRAERDLHARVIGGMQEGVLVLDKEGRLLTMNPALRAMLLIPQDSNGKHLLEVVRHAELEALVTKARTKQSTALGEIELGGIKPRRLLVHATPLAGDSGGLLAVFVDVTDLRRLESLRRDFVANVSHELRTPVTAVRSAAETLKSGAIDDPDRAAALRFVEIIDRNAERLQSLIEDLLELSRLESKEFKLKKERIDAQNVSSIVMGLFKQKADKKGIALSTKISGDLPKLETDQRALEQVLSNLVDNAVKYCPSGSAVTLSAVPQGAATRWTVEDTGPGIAAKHLSRIFERFYRVDAGRSREIGGTGLGLSIVKHLVEAMGGEVSVESVVGKGTTFAVVLGPRARQIRKIEAQV